MTIDGRSEELVSRCVECDLAEPESLTSLGGSAPGLVDGILSTSNKMGVYRLFCHKQVSNDRKWTEHHLYPQRKIGCHL